MAIKFVRIYISESDKGKSQNLMHEIFSRLHDEHIVHGVTVFRGIAGFGEHGEVHSTDLLRLHVDLPLIVEFFDEPEAVERALASLSDLVPAGHVVQWDAERA